LPIASLDRFAWIRVRLKFSGSSGSKSVIFSGALVAIGAGCLTYGADRMVDLSGLPFMCETGNNSSLHHVSRPRLEQTLAGKNYTISAAIDHTNIQSLKHSHVPRRAQSVPRLEQVDNLSDNDRCHDDRSAGLTMTYLIIKDMRGRLCSLFFFVQRSN
jgi:hypothetical protein